MILTTKQFPQAARLPKTEQKRAQARTNTPRRSTPQAAPGPFGVTLRAADSALLHVPPLVRQSTRQNRVDPDKQISVAFALSHNNEAELSTLIEQLHTPDHKNYGRYLTPAQFAARFHPTPAQMNKVRQVVSAAGLQTRESRGLFLHAYGRVKDIEALLETQLHTYKSPTGRAFFAASGALRLPANTGIRAVHGLHNAAVPQRTIVPMALEQQTPYNAEAIRSLYNVPSSLTGTGQTLGLIEFSNYDPADIRVYADTNNIANYNLVNVGNSDGTDSSSEVTLDIEMMLALAPDAKQINVYQLPSTASFAEAFNQAANPGEGVTLPTALSVSYGIGEGDLSRSDVVSENAVLMQMAAQGQTLFASSGDTGAFNSGTKRTVNDPASQPLAVSVGGTTIQATDGDTYVSETTWTGSGGGISHYWSIPTWQKSAITAASLGSQTMRNVPDVSLNADPNTGYLLYYGGGWYSAGGTSASAPLWAAFTALANQDRLSKNQSTVGFMAPQLYDIAHNGSDQNSFHDIADGSTNGYYPATPGYDLATGLGSFDGANLLQVLSGVQTTPTVPAAPVTSPSSPSPSSPAVPSSGATTSGATRTSPGGHLALGLVCYLGLRTLLARAY